MRDSWIEGELARPRTLPRMLDLSGRKVLVTGAANGIGQATARAFAELGADLVLTDMVPMDATRRLLAETEASCQFLEGDLTDEGFIDRLLAIGPHFALANVAAAFLNKTGMTEDDHFDLVMHVNLRAPMKLAIRCVDQMAEAGGGHVVLVGSVAGRHGGGSKSNGFDYAAYAASKGGLHTAVKWLSRRAVGRNVMVNSVAPGAVDTRNSVGVPFEATALPMGRLGKPEELGWSIALLCTPAAGFTSGVVLDVNGGSYVAP